MRQQTKYIVVHSAATTSEMDIGVKEIDRWHRAPPHNFLKVGYHFVIRRDGTAEVGRDVDEIGAHCKGFNRISVGICMAGGLGKDGEAESNFTNEQYDALRELLYTLQAMYPDSTIVGHRDLKKSTECPSFNVKDFVNDMFI